MIDTPLLSPRFGSALVYASMLHASQVRKGTPIPYVSHLLAVASLVLEFGGGENEAIAALLHDALEDCGPQHEPGMWRLFGDAVTQIVLACTDGTPDAAGTKAPWKERKERYLAHLPSVPAPALLVSCCDKLHNLRSLSRDLRQEGLGTFGRFKGGLDGTLWYYRALAEAFVRLEVPAAGDLHREMDALEALVAQMRGASVPEAAIQA